MTIFEFRRFVRDGHHFGNSSNLFGLDSVDFSVKWRLHLSAIPSNAVTHVLRAVTIPGIIYEPGRS